VSEAVGALQCLSWPPSSLDSFGVKLVKETVSSITVQNSSCPDASNSSYGLAILSGLAGLLTKTQIPSTSSQNKNRKKRVKPDPDDRCDQSDGMQQGNAKKQAVHLPTPTMTTTTTVLLTRTNSTCNSSLNKKQQPLNASQQQQKQQTSPQTPEKEKANEKWPEQYSTREIIKEKEDEKEENQLEKSDDQVNCESTVERSRLLRTLLTHQANVNHVNKNGWTPLLAATANNQLTFVECLLENGADPNCQENEHGDSPLHIAARQGQDQILSVLMKNGADPNLVDREGNTPLHSAVTAGRLNIAVLLLEQGTANFEAKDRDGISPYHIAKIKGFEDIVNYFDQLKEERESLVIAD